METIGKRLEYVRKQRGYTYGSLAELVGISGDAIRIGIKKDKIKEYYINVFAEKLQVNRQWLIFGNGDMLGSSPVEMSSVKNYLGQHEVSSEKAAEHTYTTLAGYKELAEARLTIIDLLTAENERLKEELDEIRM